LQSLDRILRGDKAVELRFMDGPFVIHLSTVDRGTCSIDLRESLSTTVLATSTGCILDIIAETERVADEVVKACLHEGWHSPDLDSLRHMLHGISRRSRKLM
jgi:hypothetical protein